MGFSLNAESWKDLAYYENCNERLHVSGSSYNRDRCVLFHEDKRVTSCNLAANIVSHTQMRE